MDGIGQPGITRISCKGVRLIIPKSGDWFFEVFYTKKVEDNLYAYFHKDSFRLKYVGTGKNRTGRLTACPKRSWDGKCKTALVLLSLRHPMTKLAWYKKECKVGKLSKRRKSDVKKIANIVKAYNMASIAQPPYPGYKDGLRKRSANEEELLTELLNFVISNERLLTKKMRDRVNELAWGEKPLWANRAEIRKMFDYVVKKKKK